MNIQKPAFIIETPLDPEYILQHLERAGRTAYKSEDRITSDSAKAFVGRMLQRGHESVIEHCHITVRIVCDRGVSHEIVRHRMANYTQESTRYCNYTKGKFGGEITVIEPCFWEKGSRQYIVWEKAMDAAENAYRELVGLGASPQEARSVLPNSLKTEIVVTMNLREWRHFLSLRTAVSSHPQIREIAVPLLEAFKEQVPVIFDDITIEEA